jgi:hypothetical protein
MQQAADIDEFSRDPESRSAVVAYFEWDRMNQVFPDGTPGPDDSPVPTWGWGKRKPNIPTEK